MLERSDVLGPALSFKGVLFASLGAVSVCVAIVAVVYGIAVFVVRIRLVGDKG